MALLSPILLAGLTGLISGVLLSVPIGPINLTIINEGVRRGFKWGVLIGLGATVMESIYCFVAFTGFASFFSRGYIKVTLQTFSFLFLLYLGIRFLLARSSGVSRPLGAAADRIEIRLEEKLHPHSAFMTGFVRVMANVGVLVFWVILAANFIWRGLVRPDWPGKCACVAGVTLGTGGWFVVLSWVASLGRGKFSEKTLVRIEHFSGVVLLAVALLYGGTIIWEMRQR
jgi:threonine/homoserine/homoserine lactone efflux protein